MISAVLLMGLGCLPDTGHPAPADSVLSVSSLAGSLTWSEYAQGIEDGIGVLTPVDALVESGPTGLPLPGIQLEVISGFAGIYLLPEAAIQEVDPPNPVTAGSNCDPNAENYDVENCPWYDSASDRYFQLSTSYTGSYKPNYLLTATDNRGLARVWVYIDAMPENEEGDFQDSAISVSTGYESEVVEIAVND